MRRRSARRRSLAFLEAHRDELRSDVLVLADAGNWKVGVPGLTYSLRGLAAADIELRALDGPVHSGMAGGAIPDPVAGLARLLASLVDERGDLRGRGHLGRRTTRRPRRNAAPIAGLDDDPVGLRPGDGPAARRRARRRPGDHAARAAVVPSVAHGDRARRAPDQGIVEPGDRAGERAARACGSCPTRIPTASSRSCARTSSVTFRGDSSSGSARSKARPRGRPTRRGPAFDAARRALRAGFGVDAVLMGVGGSIPFVGPFADAFGGIPALLLGPAIRTVAFTARTRACISTTGAR